MKRALVIVLMILLVSSAMFAGGGRQQATTPGGQVILRTGVIPVYNSVATKYAVDQGWDIEAGLKIEMVSFPTGVPMAEALGADLLDVGIMSGAAITALSAFDCVIIGEISSGGTGLGLYVRPDSPILGVKGANRAFPGVYGNAALLKGIQILLPIGTWAHWDALKWMEILSVNPNDVNIVHMDFNQAHQAFLAGHGDAVAQNPPVSFRAVELGWVLAAGLDELEIPLHENVVVNPKTFRNPDMKVALQKFLELQFRANEAFSSNRALAEDRLSAWYRDNGVTTSPVDVANEIATKKFFTRQDARTIVKVGASARLMAEFMVGAGTLEANMLPKFTSNVDSEIWNKAINN